MYAKTLGLSFVGAIAFTSGTALAAGIAGTDHDFSGEPWSGGDLCEVCHTPHNADVTTITGMPLWAHDTTTSTFTVYTSPTFDGAGTIGQPSGASLACLSCHDGTVAIDSYSGRTGTDFMTGSAAVGTDLTDDHPISFDYTTALATTDGGLFDPSTTASGLTTSGTIDGDMLFSSQLQCATCHDVHDKTYNFFLRMDNTGSALCLTCHDK